MVTRRITAKKGRAVALPIFVLAAIFLVLGAGLRFSGKISTLQEEEAVEELRLQAALSQDLSQELLASATDQNSTSCARRFNPIGSEYHPAWDFGPPTQEPLPLAAEQALALSERGQHEAAWNFFQHPSTIDMRRPDYLCARLNTVAVLAGQEAARDELLQLDLANSARHRGLPFALVAAAMMSKFDEDAARPIFRQAISAASATASQGIPLEAVGAIRELSQTLGLEAEAGIKNWLARAQNLKLLRESGLAVAEGSLWLFPNHVLIGQPNAVILRDRSDLQSLMTQLENDYRSRGRLRQIVWEAQASAPIEELKLQPVFERESERLEFLSFFLLACAAVTGLLGGWSSLRLAKKEAKLSELKSDFVDLVSHELRTPLTILSLKTEMLATQSVPPEKHESYLRDLDHEVAKLRDLVDGLLDFSRLEKGHMSVRSEDLVLRDLVAEVVATVRRRHRGLGQKLRVQVPRGRATIAGDQEALARSLLNLLDNSAKYAGHDATVCLSVDWSDERVTFQVSDNGPGVPPQLAPRIFERFVRGHHSGIAGSGLGLALVQATAVAHGGQLLMNRHPVAGAEFTIDLPRRPKS